MLNRDCLDAVRAHLCRQQSVKCSLDVVRFLESLKTSRIEPLKPVRAVS